MHRPEIPSDVKRQLRQEAGFGCCFCGFPFCDYHHINPWARKNAHDPDDLMLVCPNHHRACRAAIPEEEQREAKRNPTNIQSGLVNGKLYLGKRDLIIDLGSTIIRDTPSIFSDVESKTDYMGLKIDETGILNLSMILVDKNGTHLGVIRDNEWTVLVDDAWDLEATEQLVTCRLGRGDIAIRIDARKSPVQITGCWNFNGSLIDVARSQIKLGSNSFSGGSITSCGSAFGI